MSRKGRWLTRVAGPGDGAIRRRMDVTRLFTQRLGERLTVNEVAEHTPGKIEQVREVLEELVGSGWLRRGRDAAGHVAYWRKEPRRG